MTVSIEQGLRALRQFLAQEWRLALPVALAFLAMPPLVVTLLLPPVPRDVPATMAGMRALGESLPVWTMPAVLLIGLLSIAGGLALQALALVPRISVGEALRLALRRLPAWIAACLIVGAAMFAILVALGILVGVLRGAATVLVIATMGMMIATSLSLVLVMPIIVHRGVGPVAALREGVSVYRGVLGRVAAGLLLFLVGGWLLSTALQLALGSVLLLAGDAAGQADLGRTLVALLGALLISLQTGAFYLFAALLYRQRVAG